MEPQNRPYIDPDTKPGDAGTEDWADNPRGLGEPAPGRPRADPVEKPIDDGIIDGSPAEVFVGGPAASPTAPLARDPAVM